ASFENNYRWMRLTVGYGSRTVGVWHIDDDGVFRLDGATSAATLELWPTFSGGYPQYPVTPTRDNYRYGIPVSASDGPITTDLGVSWASGPPVGGYPSLLALSGNGGYCGVATGDRIMLLRRLTNVDSFTWLHVIVGDLCEIAGL